MSLIQTPEKDRGVPGIFSSQTNITGNTRRHPRPQKFNSGQRSYIRAMSGIPEPGKTKGRFGIFKAPSNLRQDGEMGDVGDVGGQRIQESPEGG